MHVNCRLMSHSNLSQLFYDRCHNFENCKCVTYVNNNESVTISYLEMITQVEEFLIYLKKTIHLTEHEFIGITSYELLPEIVVLIIGILKSNNAFVFLDPTSSVDNITATIKKLNVNHIIGRLDVCEQIGSVLNLTPISTKTISVFGNELVIWKMCEINKFDTNVSFNYAYAMFSSGSTNVPKIVKVPHQCIVPNILDLREIYKLQTTDTLYISTPMTFDPCITDIFLAISSGSCILLANYMLRFDSNYICKFFSNEYYNVTVWYTTPALFLKWFPRHIKKNSLRILILGGESFPCLNFETWPFLKNVQVYNIYGITEVSCWASIYPVTNFKETIALGSALSDTILEVRNDGGLVINDGEGEIYIGSENRICIVNDENEFVCRPCFRATGDIVKVLNKNYYYVGRKDRRIKLYGHQIDLSMIESIILHHTSVKCCCCVYIEDEQRIISLVELLNNDVTVPDLEAFIKAQLPFSMLPTIYFVPQIPLNENGKVCAASCKTLYLNKKINNEICPKTFKKLWIKYTKHPIASKKDESRGFIQSGGNSFSALQFSSALANIGIVSEDLLAFLISDKTYFDCLQLTKTSKFKGFENSDQVSLKRKFENVADLEGTINFTKTLGNEKRIRKLIRVLYKGTVINLEEEGDFCFEEIKRIDKIIVNWKHDLGKCVDASPTLVIFREKSYVICGSHSGQLIMVDVQTGSVVWSVTLSDRIESSACVSEFGDIFIGCYDKRMYCINMVDSNIKWHFQTDDIIKSTAAFHNNQIFFGSYDHYFYCLCSIDGSLLWKVKIDEFPIYATAVIIKNIIAVGTLGGNIAFIDRNNGVVKKMFSGKPVFSNPTRIPNQELLVFIDVGGVLRLFDTNSFVQLWSYQVNGNVFSSVSISSLKTVKIIFGCHDKNVYCFEISKEISCFQWKTEVDSPVYATPFICETSNSSVGDNVNHIVIIATTLGNIYILDTTDGTILTTYTVGKAIFSSPLVYNSNIFVGCRDNYLYCLSVSQE